MVADNELLPKVGLGQAAAPQNSWSWYGPTVSNAPNGIIYSDLIVDNQDVKDGSGMEIPSVRAKPKT
jgi:hypothetical protein